MDDIFKTKKIKYTLRNFTNMEVKQLVPNWCKCNLCKQYVHGIVYLTDGNVTYVNNTYMELST